MLDLDQAIRERHPLDAWHESPLYNERERAALAWTEAVTLVSGTHVPDGAYDQAHQHFSERNSST
jgi:alkylhydroperoxidase family enzyme